MPAVDPGPELAVVLQRRIPHQGPVGEDMDRIAGPMVAEYSVQCFLELLLRPHPKARGRTCTCVCKEFVVSQTFAQSQLGCFQFLWHGRNLRKRAADKHRRYSKNPLRNEQRTCLSQKKGRVMIRHHLCRRSASMDRIAAMTAFVRVVE